MVKVKICGLTRPVDIEAAHDEGADLLGLVLEPSSPRSLPPQTDLSALRSAAGIVPFVAVFGPFRDDLRLASLDFVQAFAHSIPQTQDRPTIPVIRLTAEMTLESALLEIGNLPLFLLDPFHPSRAGGTGMTLDWGLAAEIRQATKGQKLILAGGLNPQNVAEAVRLVRPYAVDASSGLESAPGIKDNEKLRSFVANARAASAS